MENLKIESVICAPASVHRRYENRPSHAFIFKNNGQSRYYFDHSTLTMGPGDMLFIPKGTSYTVQRIGEQESAYSLINFQADLPRCAPILFPVMGRLDTARICAQLQGLRVLNTPADRYRLFSLFYSLAACAWEIGNSPQQTDARMRRLSPALEYMKQHMFDPDLRIGKLSRLCGMSDTHFRTLFVECFGLTPKKYVLHRRLVHAKAVLDNGEYDSIGQAALLSGFDDPLYFSKVFKQYYGCPPSQK